MRSSLFEVSRWLLLAVFVAQPACAGGGATGARRVPLVVEESPEWELVCPDDTERKGGQLSGTDWWCEKPDGTLHGHNISHYPGGQIKERGAYLDGQRDGRWTSYHPEGTLAAQMYFERGKPVGEWHSWHDNGTQWQQQSYRNGERHGDWIEWWSNGNKRERREYLDGTPVGKATWWAQGGEVLRVEHYEDGQVVRTVKRVGGEMIVQER